MRVRNVGDSMVTVASLPIAPGRSAEVSDNHWDAWLSDTAGARDLAARCLRVGAEEPAPAAEPEPETAPAADRAALIADGLRGMPVDDADLWTRDGKAKVDALQEYSGVDDVTAAERDAAQEAVYPDGLPSGA